jgi:hypothetical protein
MRESMPQAVQIDRDARNRRNAGASCHCDAPLSADKQTSEGPPLTIATGSPARQDSAKSAQNDRTAARLPGPGFIVTTRKTAARESGAGLWNSHAGPLMSRYGFGERAERAGQHATVASTSRPRP